MRSWQVVKKINRLGYKVTAHPSLEGIEIRAVSNTIPERWYLVRTLGDTAEQLYTAVCRLRELVRADCSTSEQSHR